LAARYREKKTRRFRVESAIFLFTRRVLALFRVNPAKSFKSTQFFKSGALVFYQSSGQPRVNPGKQEGGMQKKSGEFSFRGISQPTFAERL